MAKNYNFVFNTLITLVICCGLSVGGCYGGISPQRKCVLNTAISQIGVKEEYANGGKEVNKYLKTVGLPGGYYWCAAFVKWVYNTCGIKTSGAQNGAARSFFATNKTYFVRGKSGSLDFSQTGDVVGFYYNNLGRIGHIAIVERQDGSNGLLTIEGNTAEDGGRNGDGVYRKRRTKRSVYAAANFIGI